MQATSEPSLADTLVMQHAKNAACQQQAGAPEPVGTKLNRFGLA